MSIDKMIQTLTEMKKNWGDIDVCVKKSFLSFGGVEYVEPWLTIVKPAGTSANVISIE